MNSIIDFIDSSPTIEELNQKIDALREDIRKLEQYRNARLLVVSRLPPDALSMIFEHLALEGKADDYRRPYRRVLALSQVSRLWRNVALNSPRIWGCVYTNTSTPFLELILERSKSAPLYINRGTFASVKPDPMMLLLKRVSQFKEVNLPDISDLKWLEKIAHSTCPLLERLTISSSSPAKSPVRLASDVHGRLPPLRHLDLSDCMVQLNATTSFPYLQTLKMHILSGKPKVQIPTRDMLLALQNMPQLSELHLHDALSVSSNISPELIAECPRLKTLRLSSQSLRQLSILSCLSCPSIETMSVSCHQKQPSAEALAPITSAFYALIPSTRPWKPIATVESASFYHEPYDSSIKIWLVDESDDITGPPPSRKPPFALTIPTRSDFQTVPAMCNLLPMDKPLTFKLAPSGYGQYEDIIPPQLLQALSAVYNISDLRVTSTLDDLLTLLADTPDIKPKKNQPPTTMTLPALKHIYLDQRDKLKYTKRRLAQLKKMLDARKGLGAGIESLQIKSNRQFNVHDLRTLKDSVATLRICGVVKA